MRPATLLLLLAAAVLRCTAEHAKNTSASPPLVAHRVDRPALDPSTVSLVDTTATVSAVLVVLGGAGSVGSVALVGKLAVVSSLSCFSVAYSEADADTDAASPPANASPPLPYPPFNHPLLFPVHGTLRIHPNPMAATLVSALLLNSLSLFVVAAAAYASRLWVVPRVRGTVLEGPANGFLLVAYFILLPGTVLASATLALSPSLPYAGGTAVAASADGGAAELVTDIEVHVRMLGIIGAVACIASAALLLKLVRRHLQTRAELVPDPLLASTVHEAADCGGTSLHAARSDESDKLAASAATPAALAPSPVPVPSTQRAWERRLTKGRRRREAYTFVWGHGLWVDKEDGDGFVAEVGGVFGGYHDSNPWYVVIESLSLIALAFTMAWDGADGSGAAGGGGGGNSSTTASPSRPPLESDSLSCPARCAGLAAVLGGNFLVTALMRPHISPLQNLHASVGHFLLFAFTFALSFSDWADGRGFAGGGAVAIVVLASCLILVKAAFDVVAKLCELCLLRRWRFRSSASARRSAATRAVNRRGASTGAEAEGGGGGRGRSYSAISLVEVVDDDDTLPPTLLRTGSSQQAPQQPPQQAASRGSLAPPVWGDPTGTGSDARSPVPSPAASVSPASAAYSLPPRARRMSNVGSVCGSERVSVNSTSPAPRARRGESWRAEAAAAANAVPGMRQTASWRAGGPPSRTASLVSTQTADALRRKLSGGLRSGGGSGNNTPRTHLSARNLRHLEGGGAMRGTAGLTSPGQLKEYEVVESEGGSSTSE
eukprot:Rhum_TRINITY_DN14979_c12_g1::Rhum_TRINITY_DN14979_c12_g1_i1::g.131918::m.131918